MTIYIYDAIENIDNRRDNFPTIDGAKLRKFLQKCKQFAKEAAIYDFGKLDQHAFNNAVQNAKAIYDHIDLKLPFDKCIFCVNENRLGLAPDESGEFILILQQDGLKIKCSILRNHFGNWMVPAFKITIEPFSDNWRADYVIEDFYQPWESQGFFDNRIAEEEHFSSFAMWLVMFLNSKAASLTNVPANKKANSLRRLRKQHPIPTYNVVKIIPQAISAANSQQIISTKPTFGYVGTPKRTHERRGHVRVYRYPNGDVRKVINIDPMIINSGKDHIPGGHYKVET